jgi:hypothetical protein
MDCSNPTSRIGGVIAKIPSLTASTHVVYTQKTLASTEGNCGSERPVDMERRRHFSPSTLGFRG